MAKVQVYIRGFLCHEAEIDLMGCNKKYGGFKSACIMRESFIKRKVPEIIAECDSVLHYFASQAEVYLTVESKMNDKDFVADETIVYDRSH